MDKNLITPVVFRGSFTSLGDIEDSKRHVLFLGRSNSGKSSLLSTLIHNSSVVRTSRNPGSTRTINVYERDNVFLTDLPGYGYAKVSFKGRGLLSDLIAQTLERTHQIAAAMLTIDCRRKVQAEEEYLINFFRAKGRPLNIVMTKIDKLNQKELAQAKKNNRDIESLCHNLVYYSALKKTGVDFIYNYIATL